MKRLIHLSIVLVLIYLIVGCSHHEKDIFFSNWSSEGSVSDSLVRLLEKESLIEMVPLDTVIGQISLLEKLSPAKASFFKGRFLRQYQLNYEADSILTKLKASVDSSKNTYLVNRINRELSLLSNRKSTLYRTASIGSNYFKKVEDPIMTAACYIDMSNVMAELEDYEKSLYYTNLAQDIYKEIGLEGVYLRNNLNLAQIYEMMGKRAAADSIYQQLLQEDFQEDKSFRELVLRNSFISNHNPCLIQEALQLSREESSLQHLYPLHATLMAAYWLELQNLDSAKYYVKESMDNLGKTNDWNHIGLILRNSSELKQLEGQADSALYYFQLSVKAADSAYHQRDYVKVETLESQRAIAAMELESMEHLFKERVLWTIIISALIISIIVVLWLANKRHQNIKLQQIQSQLELEQARRSFAAKSIAMEEKERIIGETRKRLQEMSQEGKIKNDVASELVSMIKMHESGQIEWDNFVTLFEKVSPNFTKNLKAQYPDLSETLVKLATYLFAGMSSAQISRLLMIRLESVHQARWRLRKKMNLPNDSSLEDALRKLDT